MFTTLNKVNKPLLVIVGICIVLAVLLAIWRLSCPIDLFQAVESHNLVAIRTAIQRGQPVDATGGSWQHVGANGATPLMDAAGYGNSAVINELLRGGANINARDEFGFTPLYYAASSGSYEGAETLLKAGADFSYVARGNRRLLTIACSGGNLRLVEMIAKLTPQLRINDGDVTGFTPLEAAVQSGNVSIVRFILDHGANVNTTFNGRTVLMTAVQWEPADIVSLLLDRGANIDAQDFLTKSTALHIAVRRGNLVIIKMLLDHGANRFIQDSSGKTPASVAAEEKLTDVINTLKQYGK